MKIKYYYISCTHMIYKNIYNMIIFILKLITMLKNADVHVDKLLEK